MLIAVRACCRLTYENDASPLWLASAATIVIPFQDATSGSASKLTVLVVLVLMVLISPPFTTMPVPCEKIWTGPWLPSMTSLVADATWMSSGRTLAELLGSGLRQLGCVGSLVGRLVSLLGRMYGTPVPDGLLTAVQVAVSGLPVSSLIAPQGTVVGTTLVASAWGWVLTSPAPRAVSRAATTTPRPNFQALRARRARVGKAGGLRLASLPSLGTGRHARRRFQWIQRRVLTLGDGFWTVKQ